MKKGNFLTYNPEETEALGAELGATLAPGSVIALSGDLGAGKTTLIKGVAQGCQAAAGHEVNSPTFTYLNIYPGAKPLYHFDLYRLKGVKDFLDLGFDEFLASDGICCLEWAHRISDLLPKRTIFIHILSIDPTSREITIS